MAPQEEREEDFRLTLVRSAAGDILQGVFDNGGAGHGTPSPPSPPSPSPVGDGWETKSRIRQQLEKLDQSFVKEEAVKDLTDTVDTYLREKGELSDTESIHDALEFKYSTVDGKERQSRVNRAGRVSDLRTVIGAETGVEAPQLLIGGRPLTDDKQCVYHLWAHEDLARRNRPNKHLRMVARCSSG